MIYLDNAATTLMKPPEVGEAVLAAINTLGNSARGTHGASLDASHVIYHARVQLARLFHCPRPDHVVFTANATEALNIAIQGLIRPGDHVISTVLEHNSVLRPLYRLADEHGVQLDLVPADRLGQPDYAAFDSLVRPNTRAIVCTNASNLTGNMVDLARVGAIAKRHKILFIVDAAQTAGSVPIDMQGLGIDVLCFTGHKGLMGPQGTGGLCIREGLEAQFRPFKVGGSGIQSYSRTQPQVFPTLLEAGTLNAHGIAGLSAALDFIERIGVESIQARELSLMRRFTDGIRVIPGIRIYGDFNAPHVAIVSLNLGSEDSGAVSDALSEEYGIATRPGVHCAPRMHEVLGTVQRGAVRFSFSYFNTEAEIDTAVQALRELSEE